MPLTRHKRLAKAIRKYRLAVDKAIADLRRPFILDVAFVAVIPIVLSIIAIIFSNVAGFLTTLGLGGINAEERFRRGQTVLKSYWSECSKLKKSARTLEIELLLCRPSDMACLRRVESLLREYLEDLP